MRLSRVLAAAGLAAVTVAVSAAPAMANDKELTLSYLGAIRARANWYDGTDTLCVKALNPLNIDTAHAWITPADGVGKRFDAVDLTDTSGNWCTGNLSIPEDELYVLHLEWQSETGYSKTVTPVRFYT